MPLLIVSSLSQVMPDRLPVDEYRPMEVCELNFALVSLFIADD